MNNRLSYCGLVDPRISASDKELLVLRTDTNHKHLGVDILLYCKSHPLENWSDFIKMLYVILLKKLCNSFNISNTVTFIFATGNDKKEVKSKKTLIK